MGQARLVTWPTIMRSSIDGIRKLLTPEFDVVETATDGKSAVECFERCFNPNVLLLDIGFAASQRDRSGTAGHEDLVGRPNLFCSSLCKCKKH